MATVRHFCHFRQNHHLRKGPFAILFHMLLTINRHFCHFRQNYQFQKGSFAITFDMLTIWWLIATFAKMATALCHLIWYVVNYLSIVRYFRHVCQIRHFRQNCHFQKGPLAILSNILLTNWRLIAMSAIFAKYAIFAKIATSKRGPFAILFIMLLTIWWLFTIFPKCLPFSPLHAFLDISQHILYEAKISEKSIKIV